MAINYLDLDYIIETEKDTLSTITENLQGLVEDYPKFLNMLLKLTYFADKGYDIEKPEGSFKSWCYYQYVRIPYTFRSAYILVERGHNVEAVFLLRHIVEVFAQLRYFHQHPKKLKDHLSGNSRLSFNTIFKDFSKDYYKKWYLKQLSSIAHGGVGVLHFRVDMHTPEDINIIMGSIYDEYHLGYVTNQLIAFFYGFICFFEVFFPRFREDTKDEILIDYDKILQLLEVHMESHKKANAKSIEWYEWTDPIIRPK